MDKEAQNTYLGTLQNFNLKNLDTSQNPMQSKPIKQYTETIPYDEPGLYHGLGVFCFATATLLLGISIWNGFHNGKLLTVFGFFIGGMGQLICGIMCYKYKYYIDGTVYFYFALNWSITTCYDIFSTIGWMEPLNHREYGFHNLMGCFFTFVFFLQNLGAPSKITRVSFTTTFIGFIFSTIGSFTDSTTLTKIGGIFNIITAALAYYSALAMTINQRYKKVWIPALDGKKFGYKIE